MRFVFILSFILLLSVNSVSHAQLIAGPRIVFSAFKDGQWDLFTVSPDGDDLRQLTNDIYEDDHPTYSPDGTQLAYASRRNKNWDIYLLNLLTGETRQLTNHPDYDGAPAWHPSGEKLAFESYRARDLDIWVIDIVPESPQQGEPLNLTAESPAGDFAPVWHHQGEILFFASWRAGDNDIWSLHLSTGDLEPVTADLAADSQPAWNAVKQTIAFTRNTLGDKDIFISAEPFENPRQYSWLGSLSSPTFSPDGQSVVGLYQSYDGAQLVRLDEGDPLPHPLTEKTILREATGWHRSPVPAGISISTLVTHDTSALYVETLTPSSSPHGEPYDLVRLDDLKTGTPWLADTVDDSYGALRQRLRAEIGYDFLGEVSETLRPINFFSEASQYSSWHKSGRAVDTLFEWPGHYLQIVRQNIGGETYWRILLRCEDQSGGCGRPTTANPWNYSARARTVIAPEQGGIEGPNLFGYYVDFTNLAEIYGWERIAAFDDEDFSWTWHFKAFEYWHYQKMFKNGNGASDWYEAMLEVYPKFEVEEYFTWDKMRAAGEDPYLLGLKGVPLPPRAERWWQQLGGSP